MREAALHYARVWRRMAAMSLQLQLSTWFASLGYLIGKLIRLGFFFAFLLAVFQHTDALAGYTMEQTLLFFLTYNVVDILAQLFLRGIYGARRQIAEGDLDYYLIQPVDPLFRLASHMVDFLDLLSLLPVLAVLGLTVARLPEPPTAFQALSYLVLAGNGLLISFSIHVLVAGLAVRTQELENTIWLYRDLMVLGRFPSDIYAPPLRWALTLVVPVAVMVSFPTQALLGRLDLPSAALAFALSSLSVWGSLLFWRRSLAAYTSVSS